MNISEIIRTILQRVKQFVDRKYTETVNIQANWDTTDTSDKSFIKNKPTRMIANGGNADRVDSVSFISVGKDLYKNLKNHEQKIYIVDMDLTDTAEEPEGNLLDLTKVMSSNTSYTVLSSTALKVNGGPVAYVMYRIELNPLYHYLLTVNGDPSDSLVLVHDGLGNYYNQSYVNNTTIEIANNKELIVTFYGSRKGTYHITYTGISLVRI